MASSHVLSLLAERLEARAPLPDDDRQALFELPVVVRTLEPQSHIVREGDRPMAAAVLLQGFAYRHKVTGDGNRQILSVHIPGDPLDLQNIFLDVADHNVQTLTRATVGFIQRPDLERLAQSRASIAYAILVTTLIEASILREWVLNVGQRDSRSRIAHLLCEFAARLEENGLAHEYGYELPMTQDQLADAVGLTPVHVNRTIKKLETEGLIERERRFIRIPDWQRMRDAADFNSRYLHFADPHFADSHGVAR